MISAPYRPMRDISLDERRQILLDLQVMKSKEVCVKWNIAYNTLNHIRFFHGKSSAKARGYYHKDLLRNQVDPKIEIVRQMKADGKTSIQAVEATGLTLEMINKVWPTL